MKLLLLSGSFHSKSKSVAILNALKGYFSEHEYTFPQLDSLPFYCEDLAKDKPENIRQLIQDVEIADGIIVCTPEYNHSIPAVLKNAIDWVSRPAFNSVLKDKPVTIITQANSPVGGARAQAHIKLVFDSTLSCIHPVHEMMITGVDSVLNSELQIVDAKVEERLKRHMVNFVEFIDGKSS
ncbi:NAD(P)H-dependent oxidoreductase [Photobacterium rosenbergii]|uniref:NAD(P)H-dependent oxidoreductase n=1 Tax=Photobacterium rosenbergii TaxID=294936 RepID=A0A2T3NKS4_9GAMM|nr:NADPH-dependent FMN reductase [Photobacterium rosenbergii]PSW16124.1 NAD(P)H-dependent oxidoreductase [Photobacterium rosenbergii]